MLKHALLFLLCLPLGPVHALDTRQIPSEQLLNLGSDLGIATALYGVAVDENVKYILIGQSFRTEGIAPLEWNYLHGKKYHSTLEEEDERVWLSSDAPGRK